MLIIELNKLGVILMNKYKMICLDIDGTLLNSEHKISKNTKAIIQMAANEMKIPVILVSARMPKGILFLLEELNISQPIICYSGALIMDERNDILSSINIEISDAREVLSLAKDMGVHVSLYKNDEWYIEKMDEWAKQESEITNISPIITRFDDLLNTWSMGNSGPNKILCMSKPLNIETLNIKTKEHCCNNLNIYPSKPTYLEIMPNLASKPSAIEVLCKKLNIKSSEIIAIGDNYNDISMIQFAGLGIAMGNAPKGVKKYANDVTLTNDEDGVAVAIKYYLSNE